MIWTGEIVKKKFVGVILSVMCVLFIVGLVLIFSAPSAGQNAGEREIQSRGGSMDTWQLERIITSTTDSYRTGGLVISLIGGFGLLGSGYILLKDNTNPTD